MPSTLAGSDFDTYAATYFDGKTAQRHTVTVCLQRSSLDVLAGSGNVVDRWFYDEVELSDQGSGGARVVKRGGDARLVFSDPQAFAALKRHAPNLLSHESRTRRNMVVAVAATMAVILVAYFSIPLLASAVVALVPLETESRLGQGYAKDVKSLFSGSEGSGQCHQALGGAALDEMVAHLAKYSHGPFLYRVEVLDTDMVNAVALPGGHIFIFRGLLEKSESFDEVAGVIAHEMAHVNHRDGMHGAVRSFGFSMLADLMFGGDVLGSISNMLMLTSYSRATEQQADTDAIATLHQAGIGTAGLARFFKRLKDKEDKAFFALPQMLSTHPPSEARRALGLEADAQTGTWTLSDEKWVALKAICSK